MSALLEFLIVGVMLAMATTSTAILTVEVAVLFSPSRAIYSGLALSLLFIIVIREGVRHAVSLGD